MLARLSITKKILALTTMMGCIALGIAGLAFNQSIQSDSDYQNLLTTDAQSMVAMTRANRMINRVGYAMYRLQAYPGASQEAQGAADRVRSGYAETLQLFDAAMGYTPELKDKIQGIKEHLTKITGDLDAVVERGLADDKDAAMAINRRLDPDMIGIGGDIAAVVDTISKSLNAQTQDIGSETQAGRWMLVAVAVMVTILGTAAALFVSTQGITGPLKRLGNRMGELAGGRIDIPVEGIERGDEVGSMAKAVQVFKDAAIEQRRLEAEAATARQEQAASRDRQSAIDNARAEDLKTFVHIVEAGFDRLSSGDLTVRMSDQVAPEFEPIQAKFNASVAQLEDTIGSVVTAVGTMQTGLSEITIAATDLSQRTEQQAASLEQTVAALSEVTRGVGQTAQSADDAKSASLLAQREAEKGGEVVSRAVAAMSEIEESSTKIGQIIGVIDEIAFQTNLLALNAGVEAARAGEAGRGFAVVAQEVRGLAQRSAEAAKEIKGLIATSSAQVEQGVELVTASGHSLGQIVGQIGSVSTIITEMARSAREQALSLKEVSTAADSMDKVTQQNAAMVEETTAAAQTLSTETNELATIVARFQTANNRSAASTRRSLPSISPRKQPTKVTQMRTASSAGAARQPVASTDEWAEF